MEGPPITVSGFIMANHGRENGVTSGRQVGYFCHLRIDEKHMGAVLVTNQIGIPLEFKYTEPVTATKLHRILYGSVLERYLHETVIRDRLARELRSEPDYFITPYDERDFLGALAGREMMAIQEIKNPGDASGSFTRVRDREVMIELEDGPTLRLAFSTSDDPVQRSMVTWLQEVGRTMDVVEPIKRMAAALKTLCGEEKRA